MTTITAPSPLVPLTAPLPAPRRFTLLDAAQVQQVGPDERFPGGGWIGGYPPGPVFTHDPCSSGSDRIKNAAGIIPSEMIGAFTAYLPGQCTAASSGGDRTFLTDPLRLAFEGLEAAAVERVLATGDGHANLGPFLTDDNVDVLASGAAQNPTEALALLENAIAVNGTGLIHVTPAVATDWLANTLLIAKGNVLYTGLGTPVAVGAGYIGVEWTAHVPGTGQEWAFATGPVGITRSEFIINPTNMAEALDRSNNDVLFIAERHYLLNWIGRQSPTDPDHTQAAVLVDRTP